MLFSIGVASHGLSVRAAPLRSTARCEESISVRPFEIHAVHICLRIFWSGFMV